MSENFRGADIRHLWVDEASSIDHAVDALQYMLSGRTTGWSPPQQVPKPITLQPLDIPCKACGAAPGEKCTKTHRRHGKLRYRGYHFRRKDDARLATEAVRALNPA